MNTESRTSARKFCSKLCLSHLLFSKLCLECRCPPMGKSCLCVIIRYFCKFWVSFEDQENKRGNFLFISNPLTVDTQRKRCCRGEALPLLKSMAKFSWISVDPGFLKIFNTLFGMVQFHHQYPMIVPEQHVIHLSILRVHVFLQQRMQLHQKQKVLQDLNFFLCKLFLVW